MIDTFDQVLTELTIDTQTGRDFTSDLFTRYAMAKRTPYMKDGSWATSAESLDCLTDQIRYQYVSDGFQSAIIELEGGAAHVSLVDGSISVRIAALSVFGRDSVLSALRDLFPTPVLTDEQRIPLWLWTLTPQGPRKMRRMIDIPAWGQIEENYSRSVRAELGALIHTRPESGRIILWNGPPGTGKSFALRALGWEWRTWCTVHYIVDPETLFGDSSAYLLNVLFDDEQDGFAPVSSGPPPEQKWRLLVLEDTGEMLTVDAKEHVGQALSRLLNVTDGLLGQGLRVLVLISTNEELGMLHPAVTRPGRCAGRITFTSLTAPESAAWLAARNVPQRVGSHTLAELYGIAEGRAEPIPASSAGFRLPQRGQR